MRAPDQVQVTINVDTTELDRALARMTHSLFRLAIACDRADNVTDIAEASGWSDA